MKPRLADRLQSIERSSRSIAGLVVFIIVIVFAFAFAWFTPQGQQTINNIAPWIVGLGILFVFFMLIIIILLSVSFAFNQDTNLRIRQILSPEVNPQEIPIADSVFRILSQGIVIIAFISALFTPNGRNVFINFLPKIIIAILFFAAIMLITGVIPYIASLLRGFKKPPL